MPLSRWVALITGVSLWCAAGASASTLSYNGFAVTNAQTVTLSGSALGHSEQVLAGQITLQNVNGTSETIASYCVDVADMLQGAGSFTTGFIVPQAPGTLGATVNALISQSAAYLASNPFASAATQVAIWEAEYGTALTVSGNSGVTDLAAQYLQNVASGGWTADGSMQLSVLYGNGVNQSQATMARVPEPATVAVLGVALAGLVLVGRRALS